MRIDIRDPSMGPLCLCITRELIDIMSGKGLGGS
jgi:hypothetical protein